MKTIIFQGDSVTDADRSRDCDEDRGLGYPHLVTAKLGFDCPQQYQFLNRGVSGDRIVDLYARIKYDIINLKPDYLSILIGVNDVWHELNEQNGVSAEKYERIYGMLIEEILQDVPDVRIMILEPFITHGAATDPKWDVFSSEIALRAAAAKRTAERVDLTFVPLQSLFDEAVQSAPASYWTAEGVHPTVYGHTLIARAWLRAFEDIRG